jgi:hypothetical protein
MVCIFFFFRRPSNTIHGNNTFKVRQNISSLNDNKLGNAQTLHSKHKPKLRGLENTKTLHRHKITKFNDSKILTRQTKTLVKKPNHTKSTEKSRNHDH